MALSDQSQWDLGAGQWGAYQAEMALCPASVTASFASLPVPSGSYKSSPPAGDNTPPESMMYKEFHKSVIAMINKNH